MLEVLIFFMELCVVILTAVTVYRVSHLTARYYQAEHLGQADELFNQLSAEDRESDLFFDLDADTEDDSVIIKILKGRDAKADSYETKINALQKAQLFAGSQLVHIKRQFGALESKNLDWLREACALYLIGAFTHITDVEQCSADVREEVILLALKTSMGISREEAYQFHYKALRSTSNSEASSTIKSGESAAQNWLKSEEVPSSFRLSNQLENWGVFA